MGFSSHEESFNYTESGKIYRAVIDETEKVLIANALRQTGGNQIAAAKILGLNRNTLRTKIKKFDIHIDRYKE